MERNDQNRTSEQRKPQDVLPTPGDGVTGPETVEDEVSIAPTFVTPGDVKENSDRPVVNPVTGSAF